MKLSIEIANMKTNKDINNVKYAITVKEGILACEVKEKRVVSIVFDNYSLTKDDIIDSIEENGYIVTNVL